MSKLAIALLSCLSLGTGGNGLENGDFEAKAGKDDPVPGWTLSIGATNGALEPVSEVGLDRREKHGGRSSLRFQGASNVFAFQIASQEVEVRPGGRYRLTGLARTENVRHERNAKGIMQFDNCYMALFLFDGNGELLARSVQSPRRPSTDGWQELVAEVEAPSTTQRAEVKLFHSVSGEVWFDDLALAIEGGEPVPEPAVVFADDFEDDVLSPAWIPEIGAQNGGEQPVSLVEIDRREGSLHLSGDRRTLAWQTVGRLFEAAPGDAFHLTARVKAEDVRQELNVLGVQQFANLHLSVVFLDEGGQVVGAPRWAHPGTGSFDWQDVSLRGVAPEGAVCGRAAAFLSMSGDAWIDDVVLTRQGGGVPAYAGWQTLESGDLRLRFPPDHPFAAEMAAHGERLQDALATIRAALAVDDSGPITVFLYRDGEQGRALAGRELDFAEPERRVVHQRPGSTLGHELVHVVALRMGYAQTGLLGEGLAVWLDGQGATFHHDRAAALLASGELPPMDALRHAFREQAAGYPAAGSFCGWLVETHGLPAFKRLYPLPAPDRAAPQVVARTWDELDADWRAFLAARSDVGTR